MKCFILYLIRWQLSTPILSVCLWLMSDIGVVPATVMANLIGGCLFFFVDRKIFRGER